jgi:hypothetical protein
MTHPLPLNPVELEFLVGIAILLIIVASFLLLFFSAIIGAGVARLLYVGGTFCARKIRRSWPVDAARPVNVMAPR